MVDREINRITVLRRARPRQKGPLGFFEKVFGCRIQSNGGVLVKVENKLKVFEEPRIACS